ncbi:MAG TPA: nucleotidyltransferase family protein [Actinomycetota bacterium]|nr:nucleotidyltransferase family protein [Actinomycetota bacterium]
MDAPRARRRTCLWRAGLLSGRRGAARPASVHLWYARWSSYRWSAAISRRWVATWPETATAVAVRLDGNDQLQITTACGLQDLLQGVSRPNPRREVSSGIASCGNAPPASPRPRRGWCCRW